MKAEYKMRVECSVCGKVVIGRLPRGDDGSFWYPRKHKHKGKNCSGNWEEAILLKWVSTH